jgi:large repetitive protein
MKKIFTLLIGIVFSITILKAQEQVAPPQAFSYIATIKKANGQALVNKTIGFRASILGTNSEGIAVYIETFTPLTNNLGQIAIEIGHGTPVTGTFADIEWGINKYFLKTEADITGGTNYQLLSVTQLLSVPYALYAGKVSISAPVNTTDPATKGYVDNLFSGYMNQSGQYFYRDKDHDNFGSTDFLVWIPTGVNPPAYYVSTSTDCDDNNLMIHPGVNDICDNVDNDCDGEIDENCSRPDYYSLLVQIFHCGEENGCVISDQNCWTANCVNLINQLATYEDGPCVLSIMMNPEQLPFEESWTAEQKAGYLSLQCTSPDNDNDGYSVAEGDCNDSNPNINPGATEICGDQIDQDCNGKDQICGDNDGDGFTTGTGDCDDTDRTIFPGAPELCDNKDNNCNSEIDENAGETWFQDADGDGWGNDVIQINSCTPPEGYVDIRGDCNDNDPTIHVGAVEICDDKDNDCNGEIDEGILLTWYRDDDGDGYGALANEILSCEAPSRYVSNSEDCNDGDPTVYPGAPELCDGTDNDCDGQTDEDIIAPPSSLTLGVCAGLVKECAGSPGWIEPDYNMVLNYELIETTCDGLDNDCDGAIDEGCTGK